MIGDRGDHRPKGNTTSGVHRRRAEHTRMWSVGIDLEGKGGNPLGVPKRI
jgi:hypothetical protein